MIIQIMIIIYRSYTACPLGTVDLGMNMTPRLASIHQPGLCPAARPGEASWICVRGSGRIAGLQASKVSRLKIQYHDIVVVVVVFCCLDSIP